MNLVQGLSGLNPPLFFYPLHQPTAALIPTRQIHRPDWEFESKWLQIGSNTKFFELWNPQIHILAALSDPITTDS